MKFKLLLPGLLALLVLSACQVQPNQREASIVTGHESEIQTIPSSAEFACDVVFFGDSITADGNFASLFPELRVVNLGVYGDTLEDLRQRVPQIQEANPAKIFLLGGINSLRNDNLEFCEYHYRKLLQEIQSACPKARIIVQSVLPVDAGLEKMLCCSNETVRAFNLRLQAFAEEFSLPYVDLWSAYEKDGALNPELTRDGVHLRFDVYGLWAELVRPYLEAPDSAD